MKRADNSGNKLTEDDVSIVKGMLLRGDRQHDIASWFGVNGGRIGEVSKGRKFLRVSPQTTNLPPPGPYLSGRASESLMGEFQKLRSKARNILTSNELDVETRRLAKSILDQIERILDE